MSRGKKVKGAPADRSSPSGFPCISVENSGSRLLARDFNQNRGTGVRLELVQVEFFTLFETLSQNMYQSKGKILLCNILFLLD
jgi:hypothetical protein